MSVEQPNLEVSEMTVPSEAGNKANVSIKVIP